jgi:hypothetical protein
MRPRGGLVLSFPAPWRIEKLKTKRATYLMNTIAKVGTFDGEPLELKLLDAVHDLIQGSPIDTTTDRNIRDVS